MDDSFLRAINPSVPLGDAEAAAWIVMVWIFAAHAVVMPKLIASKPRHGLALLCMSIAGLGVACLLVVNDPPSFLSVVLAYCVGFAVLSIFLGRKASTAARRAAVLASVALLAMIPLIYFLAFSAR